MLQAIHTLHTFSILHPSLYFGFLALLTCIVCPGWYRLGRLQLASVSPAPTFAPARQRFIFYRRSTSIVLQIANLLFFGQLVTQEDGIAATIAVKCT